MIILEELRGGIWTRCERSWTENPNWRVVSYPNTVGIGIIIHEERG